MEHKETYTLELRADNLTEKQARELFQAILNAAQKIGIRGDNLTIGYHESLDANAERDTIRAAFDSVYGQENK